MNIHEEVKKKIEEDVILKEIKKIEGQLSSVIRAQLEKKLKSPQFAKDIEQIIENELDEMLDNGLEDILGYKEYNTLMAKAVRSLLK